VPPSADGTEEPALHAASLLFSLRTYAAATLALYVSYLFDLSQPVWAFMTVYIVSAPFLGMVRSKAVYRILGTFTGAVFRIAAIPNLVDAPEILVLTIPCWIAVCLYLSIIDGTLRSCAFMLAGYITALIGFPAMSWTKAIKGQHPYSIAALSGMNVRALWNAPVYGLDREARASDSTEARIGKDVADRHPAITANPGLLFASSTTCIGGLCRP
jgi:hypothetical protein